MRNALILQGDVRTRLRELADESVHCVVTSPPYWGLRDYKLEPQIWDGDPEHPHEFDQPAGGRRARQADRCTSSHDARGKGVFGDEIARGTQGSKAARDAPAIRYVEFCECGAWRGSVGLEPTLDMWVTHLVGIFRDVRRVLRKDGTLWLNCGDAFANDFKWGGATGGKHSKALHGDQIGRPRRYTGLKPKDLIGMPWLLAFALRADGWWLRSDIIWHKPAPIPESVSDRPTRAHEYLFLLTKNAKYYYDAEAIKEPASPGTHARLAQASVQTQTGGSKQTAYREQNDFGKKSHDRTPVHILQAMAKKNGINPKAKQNGRSSQGLKTAAKFGHDAGWREKQNESFSEGISGEVVLSRNKRSVWTITSEPLKDAHYAAYPTELVYPCIAAGTSEHGCCPQCGASWKRIVEPTPEYAASWGKDWAAYEQDNFEGRGKLVRNNNRPVKRGESICADYNTVGWKPTCKCENADPVPCTVLDPFSGSGTTGIVTLGLGREYIGIELKPEYCVLSEKRITEAARLLNRVEIRYTLPPDEPLETTEGNANGEESTSRI